LMLALMGLIMLKVYVNSSYKYEGAEVPQQTLENNIAKAKIVLKALILSATFIFVSLVMIHIYRTLPYRK